MGAGNTSYPGALDTTTNLPIASALVSTELDGDGNANKVHSNLHGVLSEAAVAIEAKIGTGASTPVANRVLRGSGTGTSAWAQVALATDVSGTLPVGNLPTGIANTNVPIFTSGVADDDFLRVAGTNVEGRSAAEVLSDIGGQASLTFGISNTNAVKIDGADIADDEYARFTANGLESRTAAEVAAAIEGSIDAVGTIASGTWQGTAIASAYIADDAITLAKMASGTDGNIISYDASGNPVAVATGNDGQVLTSAGAGAPPAFEDAGGGGGITHASQWRMNATSSGATSYDPLVNFEAADTDGAGSIGTAMTYSSGVFTFPSESEGIWLIEFTVSVYQNGTNANYFECYIETDNGTGSFAEAARGRNNMGAAGEATNTNTSFIFDVTDVSDHKVQFKITSLPSNAIVNASTSRSQTFANFIRLGDT